jgi:hypothetical protein
MWSQNGVVASALWSLRRLSSTLLLLAFVLYVAYYSIDFHELVKAAFPGAYESGPQPPDDSPLRFAVLLIAKVLFTATLTRNLNLNSVQFETRELAQLVSGTSVIQSALLSGALTLLIHTLYLTPYLLARHVLLLDQQTSQSIQAFGHFMQSLLRLYWAVVGNVLGVQAAHTPPVQAISSAHRLTCQHKWFVAKLYFLIIVLDTITIVPLLGITYNMPSSSKFTDLIRSFYQMGVMLPIKASVIVFVMRRFATPGLE